MNILVIAPHADDEILGVGGTMLKHIHAGDTVYVCVVTRGVEPLFSDSFMEQLRMETITAHARLGTVKTFFLEFPSVMLEQIPRHELNQKLAKVFAEVRPDVVYTPHFGDMQKDHELVAAAVMVCVRPKNGCSVRAVYTYETLSETEWNNPHVRNVFIPNMYCDITEFLPEKLALLSCFRSQVSPFPDPRSAEAAEALARLRGSTIHVQAAEAFAVVRMIT